MKMLANHLVNNSTNKLYWWLTVEKIVSTPIYILVRPIIWASVKVLVSFSASTLIQTPVRNLVSNSISDLVKSFTKGQL